MLKLEDALKGNNNSLIDLNDQKNGSIGELSYRVYQLGKENDMLKAMIDSETRYLKFLFQSGINIETRKFFENWLEIPYNERRILYHNKKKEGLLIVFASFPEGIPDNEHYSEPGLKWSQVPNNIKPDLFCGIMPIVPYKPRDKKIHKADIDSDQFPSEKKCDFCKKIFYTFTKTKLYCCDECENDAYNERRKNRRHKMSQQTKKPIVKELKHCPNCGDEYRGRGRTCGKERCRKADLRKRKREWRKIR